jgi:hypothetical protein
VVHRDGSSFGIPSHGDYRGPPCRREEISDGISNAFCSICVAVMGEKVEEEPYGTYGSYSASGRKVSCCYLRPGPFMALSILPSVNGTMTLKGLYGCEIRWQSADALVTLILVVQEQKNRRCIIEGQRPPKVSDSR